MQIASVIGNLIKDFVSDFPDMTMNAVESSSLDDRISHLNQMIDDGVRDPRIRQLASRILIEKNVPAKDEYAEIGAIFEFVRNNIRYTRDPEEYELFQKPERTLQLRIGDCDDMAILLCSLLISIGHKCILRVIGVTSANPEHIYPVALIRDETEEIPLDATRPEAMGWEAPEKMVKFSQDYDIE